MRVLFLNYEYPPLGGGAANATKYLLAEFAKRDDIQVDLVTSSVSDYAVEHFSENVRIHFLDIGKNGNLHYQSQLDLLRYSWKAYRYSKKLMSKNTYDICHAFFGIPCGFIAMKLGLPYIVSLRGSDVPFYNPRFKFLDTLFFKHLSGLIWKNAKHVVANSKGLKELALRSHPKMDVGVIVNGVAIDEFNPETKKDFMSNGIMKIVSVGRLIPRKGFDVVISALEGLKNVELTIVGEGPEKNNLVTLAKSKHVSVHFAGVVSHDDMVHYYHQSDVFVLASANEGMSNAMLEAVASGLPVLTTKTGGVAEISSKGNGFAFFNDDIELRDIVMRLNTDSLQQMSKENLAIAQAFSWKKVFDSYLDLYNND